MKCSSPRATGALLPVVAALAGSADASAQACSAPRPVGAPPDVVQALLADCVATPPAAAPATPERALSTVVAPRASSLLLHASAGGRVVRRLADRTEFGSAVRLPVVARRGDWLGVVSSALRDGKTGWVRASGATRVIERPRVRIVVDRSAERLSVLEDGKVARTAHVGIGTASTPTPTGRFAITDKLDGAAYSAAAYGCCILALSGHQTRLPNGRTGGNRLAIHGGAPGASSAGCLHAAPADLRWLMRRVPVGTLVTVRS